MSDARKIFSVSEVPAILFREIFVHYGTSEGINQEGYASLQKLDPEKAGFSGVVGLQLLVDNTFIFKIWTSWHSNYGDVRNIVMSRPILFLRCAETLTSQIGSPNEDYKEDRLVRITENECGMLDLHSPEANFLAWLMPIVTQLARGEVSVEEVEWGGFRC